MERRRREVQKLPHHEQESLCTTRPAYRQGRQLTAVKVYTVNDESQHLIISGVPSLGLQDELRRLCSRFGDVKSLVYIPNYTTESFAEGYHIQYARIQSARFAKRQIDGRAFFGGSLHVCYAPEMESISETRSKLMLRRHEVAKRCMADGTAHIPGPSNISVNDVKLQEQDSGNPTYIHQDPCIWNGVETNHDPRILMPAQELEEKSSKTYGPQPKGNDWENVGVSKIIMSPHQSRRSLSSVKKQPLKQSKPLLSNSLKIGLHINSQPQNAQTPPTAATNNVLAPILRLVPSQVKGAQKKIVFHPKQEVSTLVPSGDESLDKTMQTVRDKIRAVAVPNVKILLDRGNEKGKLK